MRRITEPLAGQLTEQIMGQLTRQLTEQITGQLTRQLTEQITGKVKGQMTGKTERQRKRQRKRQKELNGYFTVEATFLTAIILCLLIFIIYLAFFIYDRALCTGVAYQVALEGSRMYDRTSEEIEEELEQKANDYVRSRLFACSYDAEVNVELTKVSVTYHIRVQAPFIRLMERMVKSFSAEFSVTKKATRISGVTFIQTAQNIDFFRNKFENQ